MDVHFSIFIGKWNTNCELMVHSMLLFMDVKNISEKNLQNELLKIANLESDIASLTSHQLKWDAKFESILRARSFWISLQSRHLLYMWHSSTVLIDGFSAHESNDDTSIKMCCFTSQCKLTSGCCPKKTFAFWHKINCSATLQSAPSTLRLRWFMVMALIAFNLCRSFCFARPRRCYQVMTIINAAPAHALDVPLSVKIHSNCRRMHRTKLSLHYHTKRNVRARAPQFTGRTFNVINLNSKLIYFVVSW